MIFLGWTAVNGVDVKMDENKIGDAAEWVGCVIFFTS